MVAGEVTYVVTWILRGADGCGCDRGYVSGSDRLDLGFCDVLDSF